MFDSGNFEGIFLYFNSSSKFLTSLSAQFFLSNSVPQMINRRFFMIKNLNFSKKKRLFFDLNPSLIRSIRKTGENP
ncbi:hypothetical protein BpHYR1_051843 [Brachionus plicatilis]|uniref:Uncharacterized protein n=1 Tax=Brachionus plicatilis TaxID=10195 RepID=A0A3M7PRG7_BRAPC|nr:hypothetical protein BpHYR1_051843 [Brachionus plicatilis]